MPLFTTPPIAQGTNQPPYLQQVVHLDEPLFGQPVRLHDVLKIALQLDTILEMLAKKEKKGEAKMFSWVKHPKVVEIRRQLEAVAHRKGCGSLSEFVERTRLDVMFPMLGKCYGDVDAKKRGKVDCVDYLQLVTRMHAVLRIALQLQADHAAGKTKYMAHQCALLYQALNTLGNMVPFKRRLEERFEQVKQETEGKGNVRMSADLNQWLIHLTSDIIAHITMMPQVLLEKMGDFGALYR